jgi:hypothetical protein
MKKSLTSLAAALLLLVVTAPLAASDLKADLKADLLAREKQSWKDWADKKGDAFRASVVEDYVQVVAGVGLATGRETVAKAIEGHDCVMKSFEFTGVTLRQPAPSVAILNYTATQDTTCGTAALPKKIFATSMWILKDGKWLSYSYQETPID